MGVNTIKVGSRSSILTITAASHSHSGKYTCAASNAAGTKRFFASLVVHGSVRLQLHRFMHLHAYYMLYIILWDLSTTCKYLMKIDL